MTMTLMMTQLRTGLLRGVLPLSAPPNQRGIQPASAEPRAVSPASMVQPAMVPSTLITAQAATRPATDEPMTRATRSA
ncbi:hypothetical protein D3C85_872970 [compost metagenome]